MKQIKKIAIVGGGTAGFITALILKQRLNCQVDIIYSSKVGIIGVGEGSTEHWEEFAKFMGESSFDIIKKTDATCKIGIMFQNWNKNPFLHSIQGQYDSKAGLSNGVYEYLISKNVNPKDLGYFKYWDNKVDDWFLSSKNTSLETPSHQFHFNTFKLNEFLHNKAKELNIKLYDDEIKDVILNNDGEIKSLKGKDKTYNYDFYIDSTGFKRVLISKLGAKWQSYGKYLKMKAAIAFPTEDTDEYNMWTIARAMKNGWMWRIPVWGRWGNGCVYDSDYTNEEEVVKEAEKILGHKVIPARSFKFDPGALDNVWIKNCVATGLSASFVEPLEATSITTTIQQAFLLMHDLPIYNETTIKKYNFKVNQIMENIRDFIVLHYITKKNDSKFWKDIQKLPIPDKLHYRLLEWKHRLPNKEDFRDETNYCLFEGDHYIHILYGLGLIDYKIIKKRFETYSIKLKEYIKQIYSKEFDRLNRCNYIGHKEFIRRIRNTYK